MQHLQHGRPRCLLLTMACVAPVPRADMERMQSRQTALRRAAATSREVPRPATRACGPLPRWAVELLPLDA